MKKNFFLFFVGTLFLSPLSAEAMFTDVPEVSSNYEAILYVQSRGLVQGYSDGSYQPNAKINRYDFTKIIISARFSEEDIFRCNTTEYFFSDVAQGQWFTPYICTAKKNGIISGFGDDTFRGEENVTMYEALKIIFETYEVDTSSYEKPEQEWYEKYIDDAKSTGLLVDASHEANDTITRGNMAELIFRQEVPINEKAMPKETPTAKEAPSHSEAESMNEVFRGLD
ncbi:S-layer homology domain-containing protein [Candidatus Peregrinibacteria bacterium]|nr:MAG: S-layer homology domain-containing protein [Candidatus Peregrinibacteria bacterium]